MFYKKRIEELESDLESYRDSLYNYFKSEIDKINHDQNRINKSLSEQVSVLAESINCILNNPPKYRKNQVVGSYTIINVNLNQKSKFYSYSLKHNKNEDILNYVPETSIKNLK